MKIINVPRVKRQLSSSKVYHIMCRGNEKKAFILDDKLKGTASLTCFGI
ncbi:hypothetical protein SYNTR_1425 [Candidatus Syntrophocurvum alkaliphilum]|uniref:Uncharacterized protein n=1 Tax=Candidatus Syntrophocurvum alkaliphilum TaxID=2293317 RepID=A0A6I6DB95_9FIRM|nr:hypothetical protein SYNTR_1425 [Candidatus Syntrophocurvum alkaliphilum]